MTSQIDIFLLVGGIVISLIGLPDLRRQSREIPEGLSNPLDLQRSCAARFDLQGGKIVGAYAAKDRSHRQVAGGTTAFYFDKPAGFEFVAGQSIDLTLIEPPQTDAEGNTRAFSLASAPYESELMVATRMRDTAFKRVLGTLTPGSEVKIEGPFGSMTLHRKTTRPAVFLAGGIGITPFRSMLCQAATSPEARRIFLF